MTLTDSSSGRELPVEVVSGKIINEHGEPSVIVSVVTTSRSRSRTSGCTRRLKKFSAQLEERIRDATADLEAQNLKLQWQSQELARANRLKSEFPREYVPRAHAAERRPRLHLLLLDRCSAR